MAIGGEEEFRRLDLTDGRIWYIDYCSVEALLIRILSRIMVMAYVSY